MSNEELVAFVSELKTQLGEGRNVNNHWIPLGSAGAIMLMLLSAVIFVGEKVGAIESKIDTNHYRMETAITQIRHEQELVRLEVERRSGGRWTLYDMADYSAEASVIVGKQMPDPKRIATQNQQLNDRKP